MTVAAIVQARLGSSRFPGKVLEDLAGKPVLAHVLERADMIPGVDVVVLAVPDQPESDNLTAVSEGTYDCDGYLCKTENYRGPEKDVLSRYVGAAESVEASIILRITADCPLIDPELCGRVLDALTADVDYASNIEPRSWPQGLDCEAFTIEALHAADLLATDAYDREHVTTIMRRPEAKLRRANVPSLDASLAAHRWTLDWPEDLEFMRTLYRHGDPKDFASTLAIVEAHPEIGEINAMRKAA